MRLSFLGDFFVFAAYFFRRFFEFFDLFFRRFLSFLDLFLRSFFSFCCINLKEQVEKLKKSADAGCLEILSLLNFFFFFTMWKGSELIRTPETVCK